MLLILLIAGAFAADGGTVIEGLGTHDKLHSDTDAWREGLRAPIPGMLGLEAALEQMDRDIHELVMLDARWTGDLDIDALAGEERTRKDRKAEELQIQVQRVADGSLVSTARGRDSVAWDRGRTPADRACAYTNNADPRAIALATWDDSVRPQGGNSTGDAGATHATMFWLNGADSRTALVHLSPGESATVVELVDYVPGEASQQVRVRRTDRMLEVTEDRSLQRVCLQFGLPSLAPEAEAEEAAASPWHGQAEAQPWDAQPTEATPGAEPAPSEEPSLWGTPEATPAPVVAPEPVEVGPWG